MKDPGKTIGGPIDRAGVAIICSVDAGGHPNSKAMLPPRERDGTKHIYLTVKDGRYYSDFESEDFVVE